MIRSKEAEQRRRRKRTLRRISEKAGRYTVKVEPSYQDYPEPFVLLIDNKTGLVMPMTIASAYALADKLVAVAEEMEGRTLDA